MKILKISIFAPEGVFHGFGTRDFTLKELEEEFRSYRILQLKQVHSTKILVEKGGEGDGLISRKRGTVLVIKTADCMPIFLAHRDGEVIAALHGGWRGLCNGIIPAAVKMLQEMGFSPSELEAALGPSIGPCCYEVGEEVFECFRRNNLLFLGRGKNLDLPSTAELQLKELGIGKIHSLPLCTRCHPWLFYSYRRGDRNARMFSFLGLLEIK